MSGYARIVFSIVILALAFAVLWNSPQEAPVKGDTPPDALMVSPVRADILKADSLASQGAYLAALGQYESIELAIGDSLKSDADAAGWVQYRMARMLVMSDQSDAANEQLDSIRIRFPDTRWSALASYDRAHEFAALENHNAALPLFIEAAEQMRGLEAGRLAFRLGHTYHRLKQWENAAKWYQNSIDDFPIIGDYALSRAAECLVNARKPEGQDRLLKRLVRDYPHSPLRVTAAVSVATRQIESGRYDEASSLLTNVLATSPHASASDSAAVLSRIGYAHLSGGRNKKAMDIYRTLLSQFGHTEHAADVLSSFEKLRKSSDQNWSDEERLWVGLVSLEERQYGKAVQVLKALSENTRETDILPRARYNYLRAQYLSRQYVVAETGFRTFLIDYPDHPLAPEASFHLARSLRARKRNKEATAAYLTFAQEFPESERAPEALLYVARRYDAQGRLGDSAETFLRMAAAYPSHDGIEEAYWNAGYNYYRAKRYQEAATAFARLPAVQPHSYLAAKANYWAGKALQKYELNDEARTVFKQVIDNYPNSYYAYQADLRLSGLDGTSVETVLTGWSQGNPVDLMPPSVNLESFSSVFESVDSTYVGNRSERVHLERAAALIEVWLRKDSEAESDLARSLEPDNPWVLAETARMYFANRLYREGIRAADRLQRHIRSTGIGNSDSVPPEFVYPAPFWTHVVETARENEMDPLFLLAIMRQESRFDQWISSWAGAHGLMQLMPSTAKETARIMRMRDYSVRRLKEPEVSIAIGSKYISRLLKRFGGNPELALAGYNGGPTRIARWARQRGTRDIDEFVERISMDETRNFVRLVMENYAEYTSLMGKSPTISPVRPPAQ